MAPHQERLPRWLSGYSLLAMPEMQETRVQARVRKIPWRRAWKPTPVFLPGESMDRGVWWATVHRVTESDTTEAIEHTRLCLTRKSTPPFPTPPLLYRQWLPDAGVEESYPSAVNRPTLWCNLCARTSYGNTWMPRPHPSLVPSAALFCIPWSHSFKSISK